MPETHQGINIAPELIRIVEAILSHPGYSTGQIIFNQEVEAEIRPRSDLFRWHVVKSSRCPNGKFGITTLVLANEGTQSNTELNYIEVTKPQNFSIGESRSIDHTGDTLQNNYSYELDDATVFTLLNELAQSCVDDML